MWITFVKKGGGAKRVIAEFNTAQIQLHNTLRSTDDKWKACLLMEGQIIFQRDTVLQVFRGSIWRFAG